MSYRITEVAHIIGLPVTTIRYYDREGLLPSVARNDGGQRVFSDDDVRLLQLIECLKRTNMPLKDIRRFSHLLADGNDTLEQRRQMLYERREAVAEQIEDLKAVAELIERKCAHYDQLLETEASATL